MQMRTLIQNLALLLTVFIGHNVHAQNIYPWPQTGNIGIGTATPANKLTVTTTTYNDGIYSGFNGSAFGGPVGYSTLFGPSLQSGSYNGITLPGDAGLVYGQSNGQGPQFGFVITPWQNAFTGIRLDKNGNVGIAVSDTKGYQLAVNGQAIFNKVVVKPTGNWPDYIFLEDHLLPSLDSVSRYIRIYRHLPEIPSADSVEKAGIDVGANQAALLKKVEELTLYIIEQDKVLREIRQQQGEERAQMKDEREKMKDELDRQRRVQQSQQARIDRIEHLLAEKLK
jgi:hypothetical protein